ncbi:MAG: polysaccharide deacetylase family protein, partial [Gemmatimonadota bacterium]|nr:polysaccharide deacetylase family protein [Gemmatimonadota bacterium]
MPSYISAYDTEAVYAWWDAPTEPGYQGRISYEGERLAECIAGVRAVAQVHLKRQAPASFFIVAELLQRAASEFRSILDEPLFDIQCHSFTHKDLISLVDDQAALQYELVDSKKLIEDTFSRPV